ncbi:MAG: YicC/YloC family endoribonuclease [Alphaproteobacteria bacterium]
MAHAITKGSGVPISSMTAFARVQGGAGESSGPSWVWEVRSVNAKGLDFRVRLPSGFERLEISTRDRVSRRFKRGSLSLTLNLVQAEERPSVRVNEGLLGHLVEISRLWQARFPDALAPARLDGLLALKGVLEAADSSQDGRDPERFATFEAGVLQSLEEVLEALALMRGEEGSRLGLVLRDQLDSIAALSEQAAAMAALRPEAMRERLRSQLALLLEASPALPEDRLVQEMALLATRTDVREELDRLHSHVEAVRQLLAEGGAVGRRLDFLCQELNREANTLCSKASSVELTRIGLDLKSVIDQFREQVQNIE